MTVKDRLLNYFHCFSSLTSSNTEKEKALNDLIELIILSTKLRIVLVNTSLWLTLVYLLNVDNGSLKVKEYACFILWYISLEQENKRRLLQHAAFLDAILILWISKENTMIRKNTTGILKSLLGSSIYKKIDKRYQAFLTSTATASLINCKLIKSTIWKMVIKETGIQYQSALSITHAQVVIATNPIIASSLPTTAADHSIAAASSPSSSSLQAKQMLVKPSMPISESISYLFETCSPPKVTLEELIIDHHPKSASPTIDKQPTAATSKQQRKEQLISSNNRKQQQSITRVSPAKAASSPYSQPPPPPPPPLPSSPPILSPSSSSSAGMIPFSSQLSPVAAAPPDPADSASAAAQDDDDDGQEESKEQQQQQQQDNNNHSVLTTASQDELQEIVKNLSSTFQASHHVQPTTATANPAHLQQTADYTATSLSPSSSSTSPSTSSILSPSAFSAAPGPVVLDHHQPTTLGVEQQQQQQLKAKQRQLQLVTIHSHHLQQFTGSSLASTANHSYSQPGSHSIVDKAVQISRLRSQELAAFYLWTMILDDGSLGQEILQAFQWYNNSNHSHSLVSSYSHSHRQASSSHDNDASCNSSNYHKVYAEIIPILVKILTTPTPSLITNTSSTSEEQRQLHHHYESLKTNTAGCLWAIYQGNHQIVKTIIPNWKTPQKVKRPPHHHSSIATFVASTTAGGIVASGLQPTGTDDQPLDDEGAGTEFYDSDDDDDASSVVSGITMLTSSTSNTYKTRVSALTNGTGLLSSTHYRRKLKRRLPRSRLKKKKTATFLDGTGSVLGGSNLLGGDLDDVHGGSAAQHMAIVPGQIQVEYHAAYRMVNIYIVNQQHGKASQQQYQPVQQVSVQCIYRLDIRAMMKEYDAQQCRRQIHQHLVSSLPATPGLDNIVASNDPSISQPATMQHPSLASSFNLSVSSLPSLILQQQDPNHSLHNDDYVDSDSEVDDNINDEQIAKRLSLTMMVDNNNGSMPPQQQEEAEEEVDDEANDRRSNISSILDERQTLPSRSLQPSTPSASPATSPSHAIRHRSPRSSGGDDSVINGNIKQQHSLSLQRTLQEKRLALFRRQHFNYHHPFSLSSANGSTLRLAPLPPTLLTAKFLTAGAGGMSDSNNSTFHNSDNSIHLTNNNNSLFISSISSPARTSRGGFSGSSPSPSSTRSISPLPPPIRLVAPLQPSAPIISRPEVAVVIVETADDDEEDSHDEEMNDEQEQEQQQEEKGDQEEESKENEMKRDEGEEQEQQQEDHQINQQVDHPQEHLVGEEHLRANEEHVDDNHVGNNNNNSMYELLAEALMPGLRF